MRRLPGLPAAIRRGLAPGRMPVVSGIATFEVNQNRFSAMLVEPESSVALNIWTFNRTSTTMDRLDLNRQQPPAVNLPDPALTPLTGRNRFFTALSCGGKAIVIWVSQEQDEENAGPGAADALEGAFDLGDPCEASRWPPVQASRWPPGLVQR